MKKLAAVLGSVFLTFLVGAQEMRIVTSYDTPGDMAQDRNH